MSETVENWVWIDEKLTLFLFEIDRVVEWKKILIIEWTLKSSPNIIFFMHRKKETVCNRHFII